MPEKPDNMTNGDLVTGCGQLADDVKADNKLKDLMREQLEENIE